MRHPHCVYLVYWEQEGICKLGCSYVPDRWRRMVRDGATLIHVEPFHDGSAAYEYEGICHDQMRSRWPLAFASKDAALAFLPAGGGYLECYRMTPDDVLFAWQALEGAGADMLAEAMAA